MPAPTNIDATSAIELINPATVSQDVNFGGHTYSVWYKWTAPADTTVFLGWFHGNLTGYTVSTLAYTGPAASPTPFPLSPASQINSINVPLQMAVTPGETYYFECDSLVGNTTPAILLIASQDGAISDWVIGDLLIGDDSTGYPAAVLDATTGVLKNLLPNFAASDFGAILPNGHAIWSQTFNHFVFLYDDQLVEITSFVDPLNGAIGSTIFSTNKNDKFYIGSSGSGATHAKTASMDQTGAIILQRNLPLTGLAAIAPNNAETILYHIGQSSTLNAPVKRWDWVNNVALSDLVAAIANTTLGKDLIVLADDSVIVTYQDTTGPQLIYVKRYDSSGALLNTYNFPAATGSDTRTSYDYSNTAAFWVWTKEANGVSRFQQIRLSDGVVLQNFTGTMFSEGVSNQPAANSGMVRSGHSNSCPLVRMTVNQTPTPPPTPTATSGIYVFSPNKPEMHDSYYDRGSGAVEKKIPDPTIRTALIGE